MSQEKAAAPKKNQTAYFLFMGDRREKLKKENPDLSHKEIVTKLGEEWRALSETDKKKYSTLAEKDKKRYQNEMDEYIKENGEPEKKTRKGKKEKKEKKASEEGKPKKPLTAFFLFQNSRRDSIKKENPDMAHKDIIKKMSEEWNAFTDKQKKKYNDQNKKLKEKYEKELQEWKDNQVSDKEDTKEDESD